MNYRLDELSEDAFESLINMLCQRVLGTGVVSFTKGKDGGRDGRFTGTANCYPSEANPWRGKFIIQSKHTQDHAASCSDNTFLHNQTSVVNKEIPNILDLKSTEGIENYLMFTNRKETEGRETAVELIKNKTALDNVDVIGKNTIHSWLDQHGDIARNFKIGIYALPLTLTEFEIKDVILAFNNQTQSIRQISDINENSILKVISKTQKNKINNLSEDYYNNEIRTKSQQFFTDIDNFLKDFKNKEFANMYENFSQELSNKINVHREKFGKFEEIFIYLYDLIFEENKIDLKNDKRRIWVFLHHMYFNCHIGKTE